MIKDIHLTSFRSYKDASFELSPGVNIIVGPNGCGKTNLLEAILLSARGSSYRAKDSDLVNFKKTWAMVEAHYDNSSRVVQIENKDGHTIKQYKINGQTFRYLSLHRIMPTVLFEPEHLKLLSAGPELRRQFMDDLNEQTAAGYRTIRLQYKRTLAQRNALLKRGVGPRQNIFPWNVRLSELGGKIVVARLALIETMNRQASSLYRQLSRSKAAVSLVYKSPIALDNYSTNLLYKLETGLTKDLERGFTTYGPHREDLDVFLDKQLVSISASRGESRTLTLIFKILEAQLVELARDIRPLLLLDDVFSELDGGRRQTLTQFLQTYQTFITTTDADVVIQHFTENTNIIPVTK